VYTRSWLVYTAQSRTAPNSILEASALAVSRTIYIVSEGLQAPPSAGFHIHLLSLAHGLASHVRVQAFAWAPDMQGDSWKRWMASLPPGAAPEDYVVPIGSEGRSGNALARKIRYWRRVQASLAAEAREGDVLWVRDLSTAMLALPSLTRWLPGRSGMLHVYDASSLMELEVGLRPDLLRHRAMAVLERRVRKDFDLVRTLGPSMREHLIASGVKASRIRVVPVGAYAVDVRRDPEPSLRRLLYLGSASPWQGLDVLVESMRLVRNDLPDLRLSVVGVRTQDVPQLDREPNIDVLGWVERAQLRQLYADHDLFVIPRPSMELTQRVVPMKCVEAQAHSVPILASRLDAIEEVTGGESALLVEPGSPVALAEGLRRLANEPAELSRMSCAAQRRAQQFDWARITEELARALFD
jgi:glycosyltransferase involved in cell wall biosynthesis